MISHKSCGEFVVPDGNDYLIRLEKGHYITLGSWDPMEDMGPHRGHDNLAGLETSGVFFQEGPGASRGVQLMPSRSSSL